MNKTRHAAAFFGGSIESYQFSMINIRGAYFIVIALWHKTPHKVAQKIKYKNAFYLRKHLKLFDKKSKSILRFLPCVSTNVGRQEFVYTHRLFYFTESCLEEALPSSRTKGIRTLYMQIQL